MMIPIEKNSIILSDNDEDILIKNNYQFSKDSFNTQPITSHHVIFLM